jgi:hypothetical protein
MLVSNSFCWLTISRQNVSQFLGGRLDSTGRDPGLLMLLCVILLIYCSFYRLTISQAKREPVPGWATGFNWERPGVIDVVVHLMLISCFLTDSFSGETGASSRMGNRIQLGETRRR